MIIIRIIIKFVYYNKMNPKYINVKVGLSDGQKNKIKNSISRGAESISIRLSHENLNGDDIIALTKSQINKLEKAIDFSKGVTIKMSKTQIAHNMKIDGGFLPVLAGLAAKVLPLLTSTVLPALGVGALSGLASSGVNKILGNGLYLKPKNGGCCCKVETDGCGLYLSPTNGKALESLGSGLYLFKEGRAYDGSGLLLGENSPFKNVPILGLLL
jgi:hypothetical protein